MEFPVSLQDLRDNFDALGFTLLLAAGIAAAVFALVFAWRWWASHPRLPDAGPATLEFGPEPPAVANLLVNRWKVTRSAVGATLLDLCARRHLGMDQLDEDHFVVRLRDAAGAKGGDLTPYEKQVLDLVRNRATGGSCPVEALQVGDSGDGESWWKRFADAVVKDARKRGLARNRWTQFDWAILGVTLAAPLGLVALSLGQAGIGSHQSTNSDNNIGRGDWLLFAGGAWFAGMIAIGSLRDLRDTPAGQAACARWLGVRDYFRHGHAFDHAPAGSVVVWERNLSYGAAIGVAHEAVRALPFESGSPNSAWSRYGGDWHEVRIRYPEKFGSCQRPVKVLFSGVVRAAFFGGLAFIVLPALFRPLLDVLDTVRDDASLSDRSRLIIAVVAGGVLTIGGGFLTLRFLGGVIRIWRATGDLLRKSVVTEGEVVKVLYGRVAVFDGKDEDIVAWLPANVSQQFQRGMKLRVELTPHLNWPKRVEMLDGSAVPTASVASVSSSDDRTLPGFVVTLAPLESVVREATGLPLQPTGGTNVPARGMQAFGDAAGNSVMVNGLHVPAGVGGALMAAVIQRGFPRENQLPGLGQSAWYKDGSLLVKQGDQMLVVRVELKDQSADAELAAARRIAVSALASVPDAATSPDAGP
ncbi:MAG: hypothetical protein ABI939_09455 [Anaerolineaceae bacterium]